MRFFVVTASVLGLSAMPALAGEPARAPASAQQLASPSGEQQPVPLSDQELDAVSGGDLLGLNLSLSALGALNANLQASLAGLGTGGLLGTPGVVGNAGGLLGNAGGLLGGNSPLAGLLGTATGLLQNLGL
jgi:hypothetical protein